MIFNKKTILQIWGFSGILAVVILLLTLGTLFLAYTSKDASAQFCRNIPYLNGNNPSPTNTYRTQRTPEDDWWIFRPTGGDDSVNAYAVGTKMCNADEYVCGLQNYTGDCNGWSGDCFGVVPICCLISN